MRDFAKVMPAFWRSGTARALRGDSDALAVAFYLMTCPDSHMSGLYYLPYPTLLHETGLSDEGASKALARLSEDGFAYLDKGSDLVFVPGMASVQVAESLKANDNRVVGLVSHIRKYAKHAFSLMFFERYKESFSLPPEAKPSPLEAPVEPLGSKREERREKGEAIREKGVCDDLAKARPVAIAKREPAPSTASGQVWSAYASAYAARYGCEPTRNAKVNGQVAQFVRRVPAEDAPAIAATYVRSNNARYVAAGHSVGCLLQDAEKLRTELLTGRQGTAHAAASADRRTGRRDEYEEVFARLRAEDEQEAKRVGQA